MNRLRYSAFTLGAVFITSAVVAQHWATLGSAGFSSGAASFTSIAIGDLAIPYVVYADMGNGFNVTVKKYDGHRWVNVGESSDPGMRPGAYTAIAIGKNDVPFLAYQDGRNLKYATVIKYSNGNWVAVGTPKFSDGWVQYTSIAIDKDGNPYAAY